MGAALRLEWEPDADPAEIRRRHLLALSDSLLDEVEEVRLRERRALPEHLRESIHAFQVRLGRPRPAVSPATARAAHELILSLQTRLLAANPRVITPRALPGRGGGQPAVSMVEGGVRWKLLSLPPIAPGQSQDEWLELVAATVDRARERWQWAMHQARAAARDRQGAEAAWAAARAAWTNYWELLVERDKITARLDSGGRGEEMALSA